MTNDSNPPLITLVAGARPNFMKIAPILRELAKDPTRVRYELVHTGQHFDRTMSEVFFEELGIPNPDCHLEAGGGSHAQQTAKIMLGFESYCERAQPRMVVVVGDVNSTLACAIVAKKQQIEVAHVEAGLRSGDARMPEEINRMVTDAISDLFFVTEESGIEHLRMEGKSPKNIHFVGHVMIDNLFYQLDRLRDSYAKAFSIQSIKAKFPTYGVVTLHRPSNVDTHEGLAAIVDVLDGASHRLPLILVAHPRTASKLKQFGISLPSSITCVDPLPYMEFLYLWKDATVVLTDSGGLQEETTALRVPCITLRENTERPVTLSHGTNVLGGTDKATIMALLDAVLTGRSIRNIDGPPLWDGHAAVRIVKALYEHLGR